MSNAKSIGDTIIERRDNRMRFLCHVYEITQGDTEKVAGWSEIGRELGLEQTELRLVRQYLVEEKLIREQGTGVVSLTHAGVVRAEEELTK
jgi:hypothetical protein